MCQSLWIQFKPIYIKRKGGVNKGGDYLFIYKLLVMIRDPYSPFVLFVRIEGVVNIYYLFICSLAHKHYFSNRLILILCTFNNLNSRSFIDTNIEI